MMRPLLLSGVMLIGCAGCDNVPDRTSPNTTVPDSTRPANVDAEPRTTDTAPSRDIQVDVNREPGGTSIDVNVERPANPTSAPE
ncbi:MAG: hypothetical protein AB7O38_05690 [Pirellulaceae bacterium]